MSGICNYYAKTGTCRFGEKCTFRHIQGTNTSSNQGNSQNFRSNREKKKLGFQDEKDETQLVDELSPFPIGESERTATAIIRIPTSIMEKLSIEEKGGRGRPKNTLVLCSSGSRKSLQRICGKISGMDSPKKILHKIESLLKREKDIFGSIYEKEEKEEENVDKFEKALKKHEVLMERRFRELGYEEKSKKHGKEKEGKRRKQEKKYDSGTSSSNREMPVVSSSDEETESEASYISQSFSKKQEEKLKKLFKNNKWSKEKEEIPERKKSEARGSHEYKRKPKGHLEHRWTERMIKGWKGAIIEEIGKYQTLIKKGEVETFTPTEPVEDTLMGELDYFKSAVFRVSFRPPLVAIRIILDNLKKTFPGLDEPLAEDLQKATQFVISRIIFNFPVPHQQIVRVSELFKITVANDHEGILFLVLLILVQMILLGIDKFYFYNEQKEEVTEDEDGSDGGTSEQ